MRDPYTQLFVHLVWATWKRTPWLVPAIESRVYAALAAKCREFKCEPLAIGGTADHVHMLVRFRTGLTIGELVGELKGSPSHLVNHALIPAEGFRWLGGYGAFTLRRSECDVVARYVARQKEHHADGTCDPEWERFEP